MDLRKKIALILTLTLGMIMPVRAHQADSIRFSLLTCAPGNEIYELFGHTALRSQNFTRGAAVVFNYGMFSLNPPHSVYRFVKGETDYQLAVTPYRYIGAVYALRGSSFYEQELELTTQERKTLLHRLEENYLQADRVHSYHYF